MCAFSAYVRLFRALVQVSQKLATAPEPRAHLGCLQLFLGGVVVAAEDVGHLGRAQGWTGGEEGGHLNTREPPALLGARAAQAVTALGSSALGSTAGRCAKPAFQVRDSPGV